jgi:hypothetical protein
MKKVFILLIIILFPFSYTYPQQSSDQILKRLNKEIKELNFSYDLSIIKSEFDDNPLLRAAYLKGFITGYQWGLMGRHTTFPFHNEERNLIPAMMQGFYTGQYYGCRGEEHQ